MRPSCFDPLESKKCNAKSTVFDHRVATNQNLGEKYGYPYLQPKQLGWKVSKMIWARFNFWKGSLYFGDIEVNKWSDFLDDEEFIETCEKGNYLFFLGS